jgi:F-type H+-transporting ATPase subunit gamma
MATLRDIRRRITSVRNTRQITSAMRMVSAAKLNRAQTAVRRAQPYSDHLALVARRLSWGLAREDHPFFGEREGGKTLVVLFTSDRGLCGGFNANINKFVFRALQEGTLKGGAGEQTEFAVFGRLGNDFFRRRNANIRMAVVQARDVERNEKLEMLSADIATRFTSGELGKVVVAYNRYFNPIRQEPALETLLPIVPPPERRHSGGGRMTFEPSRSEILDVMMPRYLNNQFFQAHLNTEAGEHGARMVAMEGATKNAGKMIDSLTLQYNRVRQAGITKELIEIVNGAQAL